jgi:DNA ligase 1
MLAAAFKPELLEFPCYASPKLDGIRAHVVGGNLLSRTGKLIRNVFTQKALGRRELEGLDGELIVGPANDKSVYQATSSGVMGGKGEPQVTFYVFDDHEVPVIPYNYRLESVTRRYHDFSEYCREIGEVCRIVLLDQTLIHSHEELDAYEADALAAGYEGVMLRSRGGVYKFGRSTVNEGYLLKVKRFAHDEAVIVGCEEMMHNDNEAFLDELGRTKRSSAKEGLRASGHLGSFIVKSPDYENEFKVSCGSMSMEERERSWVTKADFIGKTLRYKHLPHGVKDVPRHPLYAGLRDPDDR